MDNFGHLLVKCCDALANVDIPYLPPFLKSDMIGCILTGYIVLLNFGVPHEWVKYFKISFQKVDSVSVSGSVSAESGRQI